MGHSAYSFFKVNAHQLLRFLFVFFIIVITLSSRIEAQSKALSKENTPLKASRDLTKLPQAVRVMRASIIKAAKSGDMGALRAVLQRNELQPVTNFDSNLAPAEYWLSISKDGKGRDILAAMLEVFMKPFAIINQGTDKETYVWPYLAETDIRKLSGPQEVDMLRMVTFEEYAAMKKAGKYLGYQASIGKDGTWHVFVREK